MGLFNIAEIIDMGIEKEKKRKEFYARVAEQFPEKEMKDLFTRLRDWEDQHIKKFSEIRASVKQDEATDSFPGELSEYVKALVDERLYTEVSAGEFAQYVTSPLVAIQYSIGFERDAIVFFNEVLAHVSSIEKKDAVAALIDEEKKHVIHLVELRKKIQK